MVFEPEPLIFPLLSGFVILYFAFLSRKWSREFEGLAQDRLAILLRAREARVLAQDSGLFALAPLLRFVETGEGDLQSILRSMAPENLPPEVEKFCGVAILHDEYDVVACIPKPSRHFQILQNVRGFEDGTQGFLAVDSDYNVRFLDRQQAFLEALRLGLVEGHDANGDGGKGVHGTLFSEDLWPSLQAK